MTTGDGRASSPRWLPLREEVDRWGAGLPQPALDCAENSVSCIRFRGVGHSAATRTGSLRSTPDRVIIMAMN
eukprot:2069161-Rhodomonas_salina.1